MKRCVRRVFVVVVGLSLALAGRSLLAADVPSFAVVQEVVERTLAGERDYQPGDILSKSQVEPILKDLRTLGWQVPQQGKLLDDVLDDQDYLVRQLRTKSGVKFMRQMDGFPDGYDRLLHLSRLPDGKSIIRRLIQGPDGYKLIKYLTTSDGGEELGKMLSRTPRGKNFNKPSDRIYTEKDLIARLKKLYEAQAGKS